MNIPFVVLSGEIYKAEYKKAFERVEVPTDEDKDRMREAIQLTQQNVFDALANKWNEGDDFEVSMNFDYWYHVCGGIYSDKIVCSEYVQEVINALNKSPNSAKWTYHTACETDNFEGEFFVRDGKVFVNEQEMPENFRKSLGSSD